jgi:hypothetical protein
MFMFFYACKSYKETVAAFATIKGQLNIVKYVCINHPWDPKKWLLLIGGRCLKNPCNLQNQNSTFLIVMVVNSGLNVLYTV